MIYVLYLFTVIHLINDCHMLKVISMLYFCEITKTLHMTYLSNKDTS